MGVLLGFFGFLAIIAGLLMTAILAVRNKKVIKGVGMLVGGIVLIIVGGSISGTPLGKKM